MSGPRPAASSIVAGAHVAAAAARMLSPMATASGISTSSPATTTRSTGTTASAPSGTTPPVEISIASPAPSARGLGPAGGDVADDAQHAGRVGGPDGVAVHRRARERRQVDRRARRLGEDPAGRARERDLLRRQRRGAREDRGERLGDGADSELTIRTLHQGGRGYPRGVISVVIPVHDEERSVALLYDELAAAFAGDGRVVGGRVRRRRLDRRHLRRADAAPRRARQRPRRSPAAELRQGGGARRRLRRGRGRRSS